MQQVVEVRPVMPSKQLLERHGLTQADYRHLRRLVRDGTSTSQWHAKVISDVLDELVALYTDAVGGEANVSEDGRTLS